MTDDITPALQNNLRALQLRDLELFDRVCLPVSDDHIRSDGEGRTSYRIHRTWHPFDLSTEEVIAGPPPPPTPHVFLFGLGRGEQLRALLEAPLDSILAWDRDPWLLRLLLTEQDLSEEIRSGRLRFALGCDLVAAMEDDVPRDAVIHPFLAQRYRLELRLLQEGLRDKRALVCDGTLFVDDLADALANEGYSTLTWEVQRLAPQELARTARLFGAKVVAAINYTQGLAEACRDMGLKLLVWEIDPATDALVPCRPPAEHVRIFTYRRAQIPVYQAAGFPKADYLPLAANPERRQPVELDREEAERYQVPLAFVGASMVPQAEEFRQRFIAEYCLWRGGSPVEAQADAEIHLEALVRAHREDLSLSQVGPLLEETMGPFLAAMRQRPDKPDPVVLASELVAADKRLVYVANLGQLGIRVWGDEAWKHCEEHGAIYMGSAGHTHELNKIYSGATVNVDIGRIYQSDMVTMRVFDVMACGGFVLAERNEALLDLFTEGVEMDCYTSLQELADKAEHYLAHPDEAAAIAARGLDALRKDHTIRGRVRTMLEALN
ncbi:MAG: glycosyltransferase [Myxococcota bacterium]|nr:glycosyltransferase [Myxococcota bacterium]